MPFEITPEIKIYIETSLNNSMRVANSDISEFKSFDDGWETEILAFRWNYVQDNTNLSQRCVLRVLQGESTNSRITREAAIMKTLKELDVSVPAVYVIGLDDSPIQKGHLIMEFIEGKLLGDLMLQNMDAYNGKFIQCFARLHSVDWKSKVPELGEVYSENNKIFLTGRLNHWEKVIGVKGINELDPLISYLKAKLYEIELDPFCLLHNDFHPNNIIVKNNGDLVIIDWSGSDVGDFRYDLAWTYMLESTFVGPDVGETLLHGYEQISGKKIEDFKFFEGMAFLRRYIDLALIQSGSSDLSESAVEAVDGSLAYMTQNFSKLINEKFGVNSRF